MCSNRKVDLSRRGSKKSSIRSTKGYILTKNERDMHEEFGAIQTTEDTFLSQRIKNTQFIAAGADIPNNKQFYANCESETQKNKNRTENCLKRFQQEYEDLMKQKYEIKSSNKCSIENECAELPSQTTYNSNIESFGYSNQVDGILTTNPTLDQSNLNKTVETMHEAGCQQKPDLMNGKNEIVSLKPEVIQMQSASTYNNDMMSCDSNSCFSAESLTSNPSQFNTNNTVKIIDNSPSYDNLKYFKQNENTFSKKWSNKENINNSYSEKRVEDSKYNDNKYDECYIEEINERINNAECKYLQKNKKKTSFHKQEVLLDDELSRMLDELNNDFIQIKELFTDNSLCYSNNNKMNRYNMMSAGEDVIGNKTIYRNHSTNEQNIYYDFQNCNDPEYIDEFEPYANTNQYSQTGCYQDNRKFGCTNEQVMFTEPTFQQKAAKRFYHTHQQTRRPADLKTRETNNIVHFFPWTNSSACHCGMINNQMCQNRHSAISSKYAQKVRSDFDGQGQWSDEQLFDQGPNTEY